MKIRIPKFWLHIQSWTDKNAKSEDPQIRLLLFPRRVDGYWFWLVPMSRKLKETTLWSSWYDYCAITNPWGVWRATRPKVFFAKLISCLPYIIPSVIIWWILIWLISKMIS